MARWLAPALGLPLISKDDLKVILYDTLGWGGRQRDRDTSTAAYELMLHVLRQHLQAAVPLMIESNFRPEVAARLSKLLGDHNAKVVQVRCFASRKVLVERISQRAASGVRHPGHADSETAENLNDLLASGVQLELNGFSLEVDTTPGKRLDRQSLVAQIRRDLSGES